MNRSTITARHLAITILARWDGSRRNLDQCTGQLLARTPKLQPKDRQMIILLTRSVLRQLEYLDFVINRFSSVPVARMQPLVLAALRAGCYQILFLDSIPDFAAVNETVRVLRQKHQPKWLTGFVNGVLRSIVRNKETIPPPDKAEKDGAPILNHPPWLVRRWCRRYGVDTTRSICQRNNALPLLCLRTNTRKIRRSVLMRLLREQGIACQPGRFAPESIIIRDYSGSPRELPGFDAGYFQIQDEAAQLVSLLLGPATGMVLDGCAGPGGKTGHLAQLLQPGAKLTAVEPDRRRFSLLKENIHRLGTEPEQISLHPCSLQNFAGTTPHRFNGILLDVPCSGTGVTGRHPDIRWNRQPDDLPGLQQTQRTLLETAASLLAGRHSVLVYSTCSLEEEENEQVIDSFLSRHRHFKLSDCRDFLPDQAATLVDARGFFHPLPSQGIDGFFAARLEHL